MATQISKIVLTSAAAVALAAALSVVQPAGSSLFSSAAYARGGESGGHGGGGHDGGSHDGGGQSGRSGNDGSSGGDDNGADNSGPGNHESASDDHSGSAGDHSRSNDDGHDGRDRRGLNNDDDNGDHRAGRRAGRAERPQTTLDVSRERLAGLLDGSLVATDQLGRRLEIEVEFEHGNRVVEAKVHRADSVRNPGPITDVVITPAR
jgi:hypothetical protein